MTEAQLYGEVREKIGNPDRTEISDRRLRSYVTAAMTQMAEELEFRVVTDELSMALTAEQQEYPLPHDFLMLLWASHDDKRLETLGLAGFDRDQHDWRAQASGTPTQYAIRGRDLILYPKPDSGAVTTDGFIAYSYIAAPAALGPGGPQGLSDNDQVLLVYLAALDFCVSNPSEMNAARLPGYQAKVEQLMERAKARWVSQGAGADKHHHPQLKPHTGRMGGAR